MSSIEFPRARIIGTPPVNLRPDLHYEADGYGGSIAAQLTADGYYMGIVAAYEAIKEQFADRPELLEELSHAIVDDRVTGEVTYG